MLEDLDPDDAEPGSGRAALVEEPAPRWSTPPASRASRPSTPVGASSGPSWWATASRDNFTARGDAETQKTRHRREVAGIGLRIIQE